MRKRRQHLRVRMYRADGERGTTVIAVHPFVDGHGAGVRCQLENGAVILLRPMQVGRLRGALKNKLVEAIAAAEQVTVAELRRSA